MYRLIAVAAGLVLLAAAPLRAAVLDTVRAAGVVRCGAAIRPGLAFPTPDHVWHGLEVEMCRAVAAAVLGDADKIVFHAYLTDKDFARARDGVDDVAFLTASEIFANRLFDGVLAGPTVFHQTSRIMVWDERPVAHVAELGGMMVCAEPGTGAERNLHDYMRRHAVGFRFSMWQELEEMMDAFNVGRCPAMAGEETALAALALAAEAAGHRSRMLPEALATTPVMVVTPGRAATQVGDADWGRIVGWTVQTVLAADRVVGVQGPTLPIGALSGAPGAAETAGLAAGWQARVVAAVGTYADVFARTLGPDSALGLAPGLNARWDAGGLFAPPTVE